MKFYKTQTMKKLFILLFSLALFAYCKPELTNDQTADKTMEYAIVIHGGAGNVTPERIPPEKESLYRAKLQEALDLGTTMLKNDSSSVSVVEAVIKILEDSPLFNAGKGAVFAANGRNEMDASIMDGKTLMAGAVASVGTIKNPISAARLVMEKSPHVMMVGAGAEQFATEQGLTIVDSSYFFTQERWDELQKQKESAEKHGTVGCVVLDKQGNIAAGTSTGGMTNKKYGRVGDSPIIGAGTYANNATCGISCTGHGEYFIRYTVASDVSARMKYAHEPLKQAANEIIDELAQVEGSGGLIALDAKGNIAMPFNSAGMFRAYAKANGETKLLLFKDK
jgi:beta-aspartyl-peptidase (threonine type)